MTLEQREILRKKDKTHLTYGTIFGASYGRLIIVLVGTALLAAGNIFLRWGIGEALDAKELHIGLPAMAGGLLILAPSISYIRQILLITIQKNLYFRIQSKVLHGAMASLGKNDLGEITAYYTADIGQIDGFANRILGKAFPDLVGWLITIGLIFYFDLYLGIASVIATALPVFFLHRMSRPIAKGIDEYQTALEAANQSVVAGLYNIESVKASCREEVFLRDNDEKLSILQKKKRKVALWEALLGAPMLVGAFGTTIFLTTLSGWFVLKGRITPGQLLTMVTLTENVVTFVMSLDNTISAFRRACVSLRRLNAFLSQEEEREGGEAPGQIREIAFREICFAYPGGGKMEEGHSMREELYYGFSTSWRQGNLYFIKGGNGKGKSTLIKLLTGIYDVSSGQILINGIPAEQYSLTGLRQRIVVVPQENILFRGSIRDNLVCGNKINPEQMEEACRKTGIHEEILRMPEQYETTLTENGGVLSGGQKQRLCLARALLREGDVYIFDEPTTALDQGNREKFVALVRELRKDKIVVVITQEKGLPEENGYVVEMGAYCG